jgi:hypothetical protein
MLVHTESLPGASERAVIQGLGPYPGYTDAGLPWLSAIPSHWQQVTMYEEYWAADAQGVLGIPSGRKVGVVDQDRACASCPADQP